jgi:hypothetical protein
MAIAPPLNLDVVYVKEHNIKLIFVLLYYINMAPPLYTSLELVFKKVQFKSFRFVLLSLNRIAPPLF